MTDEPSGIQRLCCGWHEGDGRVRPMAGAGGGGRPTNLHAVVSVEEVQALDDAGRGVAAHRLVVDGHEPAVRGCERLDAALDIH